MEDFGSGLFLTLNGEDEDLFCQNCRKLRQQLKEEENGREATIQVVQDKVILTDRLVKSFEKKSKLHERSARAMGDQENVNKQLADRCSKYEAELSRLIGELQFLRMTNQTLAEEKEKCSKESSELRNQIAAHEVTIQQYKNFCDEKKTEDMKAATSKKILNSKEKEISKLKEDVSRLHNIIAKKKNEIKQIKVAYKKAVVQAEKFIKNLEALKLLKDEKLARSSQHVLEKLKGVGAKHLDDTEGSFESEAEDGKRIEDLLHSDIEASPVTKPHEIAVRNPQSAGENFLGHDVSGTECTLARNKDKTDNACSPPTALTKTEDVHGETNGLYNDHLHGVCSTNATSTIATNKQISNTNPLHYNDCVSDNGSVRQICVPSVFKNSVTDNYGAQHISNSAEKSMESNEREASSDNKALVSKNENNIEADNLLLDGSNSLDDFNSDFAEMKSQICLKKEMLSPLSPLPPTPPPRSSSSPDVFRDRNGNYTGNSRPRGKSGERHRINQNQQGVFIGKDGNHEDGKNHTPSHSSRTISAPWSKNLLHQPSEGFEPNFDDSANTFSNNEYLQSHRHGSSFHQRSFENEGTVSVPEENGTPLDKSFEASIVYDEQADCYSLSVDSKNKSLVTIKAFKTGVVNFNWRNSRNRGHPRSSSCVARIESPPNENRFSPETQARGKFDVAIGSTRVLDHQNSSSHVTSEEYTDKSSSFKRKLFKEPKLPQFTATNTLSSNSLTRPSSNSFVKSENAKNLLSSSFRQASESDVLFSTRVKPSTSSKSFMNCESDSSVHLSSEEVTMSNSCDQSSKEDKLPHRVKLKSRERGTHLALNKSDSTEFSCTSEANNADGEQLSLKLGKRPEPEFSNGGGHPEFSGSNPASPIRSRSSSPRALNTADFSGFKEKPGELSEESKATELQNYQELQLDSTAFHKPNKHVPFVEPSITSTPCPKFQSPSNANEQESSQQDFSIAEKESQEVHMSEMPEEIGSMSFFETGLQSVNDKVQSATQGDSTNQTFRDSQTYCTGYGDSDLTVQSVKDLEFESKSRAGEALSENHENIPSKGFLPVPFSEPADVNAVHVTEESSSSPKKLNQTRFQRHGKHAKSDGYTSGLKRKFQTVDKSSAEHGFLTESSQLEEVSIVNFEKKLHENDVNYQKIGENALLEEPNIIAVASPKSKDISDINNTKGQDLISLHQSVSTVSLKSPQSSPPKEICSPSLPPSKLYGVDEGESLISQTDELCDLETNVQSFPKKRKRSTECKTVETHPKVQEVDDIDLRTNTLDMCSKYQETKEEIISDDETIISHVTSSKCSDIPDFKKEKEQDAESPHKSLISASSALPGNAHSPKEVCSPAVSPSKLPVTDADESVISQTELHNVDGKVEHPKKCVLPGKKKIFARSSHSDAEDRYDNQDNFDHNLRSKSKSQKAKLRSRTPSSLSSSDHKSQKSRAVKNESDTKIKKRNEVKKQSSEQAMCLSPNKPNTPDFVRARIQRIKNLNKFDEIVEPVKPERNINLNKRKRKNLEVAHVSSSDNAVNGNIQSDSHVNNGKAVSSPEYENTVNDLSWNVHTVVTNNKGDSNVSAGRQTPTVKNKVTIVADLNGINQTLGATSEIQVSDEMTVKDERNVQEQKVTSLGNKLKFENVNSMSPTSESKKLIVTVGDVHKSEIDSLLNMDCDVICEKVSNGNQENIITQLAADATTCLNGLVNINGAGSLDENITVNGRSEEEQSLHAVQKQEERLGPYVHILCDGVPTNENSERVEQKCMLSVENKDIFSAEHKAAFMSSVHDDDYFCLGLGHVSFNPMLLGNLEKLKKANSFSCKGAVRLLIAALLNPILVENVTEAVLTIIHFLGSCEDDPLQYIDEVSDINPPVILPYEEYLINCVLQVEDQHRPHLKDFIRALLSAMRAQIMFNKSLKVYGVASLCRVFTQLQKATNCLSGSRVLCYDILAVHPDTLNVPYLLAAIVGVWPEVLEFEAVFQGSHNPMHFAISYILFNSSCKYSDVAIKSVKIICHLSKLSPLENLPSTPTEVLQKIFDDLVKIENNEFLTEDQASHYAKAIELICLREGWEWAYNYVLVAHLYPFLNQWIVKNRSLDPPQNIHTLKTAFHLIYSICCSIPPEETETRTTNFIFTTLRTLLVDPEQNAPFAAQEVAFVTLLRLGSLNKDIAVPTIFTWLEKNNKQISPDTRNYLKALPYITLSSTDIPRSQN